MYQQIEDSLLFQFVLRTLPLTTRLQVEICIGTQRFLLFFCQTFLVVLQYSGSCKNRLFMLIPTVGQQEVSERKFNTAHLTSNQDVDTTQLKSNQPPSYFTRLVHSTYVHTSGTNMNGRKNN